MSRFKEYDPDQTFMFAPSMADWLPADHVVKFVMDAVKVLDLTRIYETYEDGDKGGRPAYSPQMLTSVWIYAHMIGIRASRRLERALYESIPFRILSGNQQPDFWTLNNFRTTHREVLGDLLVQTVQIGRDLGLVPMKQTAIDGTRLQANASRHSAMSYGRMEEKAKALQEEIEQYLQACDEADEQDDARFGKRGSYVLPEHLKHPARRLAAIKEAKAALEQQARERAGAEQDQRRAQAERKGRVFHPRLDPEKAVPDAKAQRNFTDPESRIMCKKGKDVIQGYNAQAAVDADTQFIVAADLTNQAADAPHLLSMLEQIESNTGTVPQEITADAGYFSERNVEEAEKRLPNCDVFIPPDRQKRCAADSQAEAAEVHTEHDHGPPPSGTESAAQSAADSSEVKPKSAAVRMREKIGTDHGRQRYKLRRCSVEPVFGQIKGARGFRQFLHRGLEKTRHMWRFECAVHNLLKILASRKKLGLA